jgi:hypothetical protein
VRRRLDDVGTSWCADANGRGQDGREHGDDDEAAAAARLAPIGLAARETAVKILPRDRRLIAFGGGGRCAKKQPSLGHEPGAAPVGEEAVMADADKRAWKHVDEKASYEISRLEDEQALPIPVPTVAIPEVTIPFSSRTMRRFEMATRCVYRPRYRSTCSGPAIGGLL